MYVYVIHKILSSRLRQPLVAFVSGSPGLAAHDTKYPGPSARRFALQRSSCSEELILTTDGSWGGFHRMSESSTITLLFRSICSGPKIIEATGKVKSLSFVLFLYRFKLAPCSLFLLEEAGKTVRCCNDWNERVRSLWGQALSFFSINIR